MITKPSNKYLFYVFAMSASITLSACSNNDNLQLGSRDDIVIMKNGVPVSQLSAPSIDATIQEDITVPVITESGTKVVETIIDTKSDAADRMEDTDVEPVTEIKMSKTAVTEIKEEVQQQAELVTQDIEMKAAKSVNTNLMNADVADAIKPMTTTPMKSVQVVSTEINAKPMATTPMKSVSEPAADVVESMEAVEEDVVSENYSETKIEGGCYKNMLIATTQAVPVIEERRVVCSKDLTSGLVSIIQQALINRDYQIGTPDGKLGNKTLNALEAYQRKNGLGVGGVTYETLEHLNIDIAL